MLVWEEFHLVTFIKLPFYFYFSFEEVNPHKSGKYFQGILQKGQPKGAEKVAAEDQHLPLPFPSSRHRREQ